MNLSGKVEETLEKLKPHPHNLGRQAEAMNRESPKFSLHFEDIRDYLIIIIGFGVCIASIFLLVIPQYGQISVISANFSSAQVKLDEVTRQSQYLESLVGLKEELESKIALADQALPATEDRVPYTLDQLVQVADISNVSIESLNLSGISDADSASDEPSSGLRTVLMQLSVRGPNSDTILGFFYNLENARTIVNINTIQLVFEVTSVKDQTTGDTSEVEGLKSTFVLESYLKPDTDSQEVDLAALANSPDYNSLFEKLNGMDFYETKPLVIEFGRDNPFNIEEATPEADDASGIE